MPFQSGLYQGSLRGAAVTKVRADGFIPEQWVDEVRRSLDANFFARGYTSTMTFLNGKKGDRIKLPTTGRLGVNDKLTETPVQFQTLGNGEWYMDIDRYKESSFLIEDVAQLQASPKMRQIYTEEAGYAIANDIDAYVLGMRAAVNFYPGQVIFNTSDGTISGTSQPLNYGSILAAKLILDRARVKTNELVLMVTPIQYAQLLASNIVLDKDFGGDGAAKNGVVGKLLGIEIIMNNNMGENSLTGFSNGETPIPTPGVSGAGAIYLPTQDSFTSLPTAFTGANTGAAARVNTAMLIQKDWAMLAMQQEPKVETGRKVEYLADLTVTSSLYGCKLYRETNAVLIHTNSSLPQVA